MDHAFKVGDKVFATTTAMTAPVSLNHAKATVVKILDDSERDTEVGPMYDVVVVMTVFEDELEMRDE